MKIQLLVTLALMESVVFAVPTEHLIIHVADETGGSVPMNVLIDRPNKAIYITTASGEDNQDGDTLQDFNTNYQATLIGSKQVCDVRALEFPMEDQINYFKSYSNCSSSEGGLLNSCEIREMPNSKLSTIGDRIVKFCHPNTIYECASSRQ